MTLINFEANNSICFVKQGDSGGPLQCLLDDDSWGVLGAASWVIGGIGSTCNPAFPGVYAFADTYIDWIQDKIDDPSWKP